jgi:myo-inositol-1-phosphate synthase
VVIGTVCCAKLALDGGISDPLVEPSSYLMNMPPTQFTGDVARQKTEEFITNK